MLLEKKTTKASTYNGKKKNLCVPRKISSLLIEINFSRKKKEFVYYYKQIIPDEETLALSTYYKKISDHPHLPPSQNTTRSR
jgi:hypothetical protein